MASVINTGLSALNAYKRQLETTGHNIANVNTEGYSRQTVSLRTRTPELQAGGYVGSGVEVAAVRRNYDDFIALRVRDYTAAYEDFRVYEERARQVDNVIADASAGINQVMQQFFAAVQDAADDPTSIEARTVVLNRASQLTDRFNTLDRWLGDLRRRLNQDLEHDVGEINALAQSLVEVNQRIGALNGRIDGIPSDVLDQRDRLVDQLSEYTSVSTVTQDDGTMNVFIGTGQALVVGGNRNVLAVTQSSVAQDEVELVIQQTGGANINVTQQMTGGRLGGLLRFRDEVLDETQNALGRVAIGLASFFNDAHRRGLDLDGELGGAFFASAASPQVLGDGNVSASFTNIGELTTHEYELLYDGANWTLTDLTTGGNVPITVTPGPVPSATVQVQSPPGSPTGFALTIADTGAAAAGDTYRVRPTRLGAGAIDVLIGNERDFAAADPLLAAANPANAGTGTISAGGLAALGAAPTVPIAPAISISYQAGNQLAITAGPAGPPATRFVQADGTPIGASTAMVSGQTYYVEVPTLGTFAFEMTGSPQVGDSFTLADNSNGVGDNRNARRLAGLQQDKLMAGGSATLADSYGALVAHVGTRTQQGANNAAVQENLLNQAKDAKSEMSGVNLDEEAADLVRFQQAYQAAAQVINVANSLFDSLLAAVRR